MAWLARPSALIACMILSISCTERPSAGGDITIEIPDPETLDSTPPRDGSSELQNLVLGERDRNECLNMLAAFRGYERAIQEQNSSEEVDFLAKDLAAKMYSAAEYVTDPDKCRGFSVFVYSSGDLRMAYRRAEILAASRKGLSTRT